MSHDRDNSALQRFRDLLSDSASLPVSIRSYRQADLMHVTQLAPNS